MAKFICAATGLVAHVRHQDAAKTVGRVFKQKATAAQVPLSFYRCDHCRRWHTTSFTPQESRHISQVRKLCKPKAKRGER